MSLFVCVLAVGAISCMTVSRAVWSILVDRNQEDAHRYYEREDEKLKAGQTRVTRGLANQAFDVDSARLR